MCDHSIQLLRNVLRFPFHPAFDIKIRDHMSMNLIEIFNFALPTAEAISFVVVVVRCLVQVKKVIP